MRARRRKQIHVVHNGLINRRNWKRYAQGIGPYSTKSQMVRWDARRIAISDELAACLLSMAEDMRASTWTTRWDGQGLERYVVD